MVKYKSIILLLLFLIAFTSVKAQEESPFVAYDVPTQNLLKFNRFLLNPTFSTVREDQSYVNLFHRNQSVAFENNNETYFLSYSGRVGDQSGLGLGLYAQQVGLIDNFGILANYAYGIKLNDKSNFTFGANFSFYNSGLSRNRTSTLEDDPLLNNLDDTSLITFQPGFNLSYGNFDFGAVADNLLDYNLKTSEPITPFNEKTYTGHLQYTHRFKKASGIFEEGRVMPLVRLRNTAGENLNLNGSLILDLPKLGWLQAGYDDFYGAAGGIGFNLNKRISLGYTVEKPLSNNLQNLGVNHEISLAYSFVPNLTEDRVMLEKANEALVKNDQVPVETVDLTEKDLKIADLKRKLAENDAILDELLLRQDSIEQNRNADLERRFNSVMTMVRRETNGSRPDLEERAKEIYFNGKDENAIVQNIKETPLANHGSKRTTQAIITHTKKDWTNNSKIPIQKPRFKNFQIDGVDSGNYIIANVFQEEENLYNFIDRLGKQGIDANFFTNPKNGLNYVYLENFENPNDAIDAYKSNLNGAYDGSIWVMRVKSEIRNYDYTQKQNASYNNDQYLKQRIAINNKEQTGVPSAVVSHFDGVGSGFYIIANVFANPKNARRFVDKLKADGFDADYFINPENQYRYVYIKKHKEWTTALTAYYSNLDDSYQDPMWIMRVRSSQIA